MKERQFFLKSLNIRRKRMISKLIPDLLSCPTHFYGIIAPKKFVEKEKNKKKLPSRIYDNFHAHLVETKLKTQESNMHEKLKEKLKKHFPYILTEERYGTSMLIEFTSMKFVKGTASTTTCRRLCCFA